jgi:hypothetical protein
MANTYFACAGRILVFTLKALTHSDAESRSEAIKEENDNLPALFAILRHIKGAEDAVEPSMSEVSHRRWIEVK